MKKVSRIITSASTLAMAALLAACGGGRKKGAGGSYEFEFWVGFGSDYSNAIKEVVAKYNNQHSGSVSIKVNTDAPSYNDLRTKVLNNASLRTFPNFTCGYPDHFADYNEEGILVPLDDFITRYNTEHAAELSQKGLTSIIDDFYPEYMDENRNVAKDDEGNPVISGIPFNKSTEVMVVNGYYFDYFKSIDPTIDYPTTWAELSDVNTKLQAIVSSENLLDENNKYIIGVIHEEDPTNCYASDFEVVSEEPAPGSSKVVIQKIDELNETTPFYALGYDSSENAFITLLHQWGYDYTSGDNGGKAKFWGNETAQSHTLEVLNYFKGLYDAKAFTVSKVLDTKEFCTESHSKGQVLFTIGSSGGLSKAKFKDRRVRIKPMLYKDVDKKYVISQGTSLGLLNQYVNQDNWDEEMYAAFSAMVELTTGELQADWVTETGYFPASKSANDSPKYQSLINKTNPDRLEKLYQDAGKVNNTTYTTGNGWHKFVDPGFPGSNSIRVAIGEVLRGMFKNGKTATVAVNEAWDKIDGALK